MFSIKFLNGLSATQINNLYRHYQNYITLISHDEFISFHDWINNYHDLPNILWSMTK